MEQNNFEELEAVEIEESKVEKTPELKEYEKLLIKEKNRVDFEKAVSLISFGCFNQKEEATIDFTKLEYVASEKKYKGIYKLYRSLADGSLVFICPLVENNKGDVDEDRSMKPYAYDCIYLENVNDETFELVKKAAKNNINNNVKLLYKCSFIAYFILLGLTIATLIFALVVYSDLGLATCIGNSLMMAAPLLAGCAIALPLLVLISIKYRNYKDQ